MLRFTGAVFALSLVLLMGCQQDEDFYNPNAAEEGAERARAPLARQEAHNLAALDTFPLQVRSTFQRDYPNAAITSARVQETETGPLLYRVVFIENGEPRSVSYDRAGVVVELPRPAQPAAAQLPPQQPAPPVVIRPDPPTNPPVIIQTDQPPGPPPVVLPPVVLPQEPAQPTPSP